MRPLKIDNNLISTPILNIIKDIRDILHGSKLQVIKSPRGSNIRVTCPSHKEGQEKRPSADIYIGDDDSLSLGYFHCFTCGEEGPFYHFVAECFGKSDEWAKKWLITNYSDGEIEYIQQLTGIEEKKKEEYLDESILNTFEDFHPYMLQRKLTKDIISRFEIKYDSKSKCLVFPVRDDKGKLFMLTRRSVEEKKFIIDADKEKPIYLLYYIKQHNIKEATLFESQINALTAWGYGFPSICSFGCNITEKQLDLINKSGIRHLYICYDGDDAGEKGTKKVIQGLSKDIIVDVIEMVPGEDVNSIDQQTYENLPIIDGQDWLENHKKSYKKHCI